MAATPSPAVDVSLNPILSNVKPSKTMMFADMAMKLKEEGVDIISLSVGEPDFDTPEVILQAGMEALKLGKTRYTPNVGTTVLRKAICKKLKGECRIFE
jgi:aspartate/glutamate/aspartate-prephenate aminotransferase